MVKARRLGINCPYVNIKVCGGARWKSIALLRPACGVFIDFEAPDSRNVRFFRPCVLMNGPAQCDVLSIKLTVT